MNLEDHIRTVPNFPKPGVLFYDIGSIMSQPDVLKEAIKQLHLKIQPYQPQLILGIESRGFLFAPPLAMDMNLPFGMVRKPGKLPGDIIGLDYALEYGEDRIEIQKDAIQPGQRVAIIDDLLATGGTMQAAVELVKKAGGVPVVTAYVIELENLKGRDKIDLPQESLVKAEG